MILVNGPAIARLCGHSRKWAHAGIREGRFGPVTEHKGILYVGLDRVEARMCLTFSKTQIDLASETVPGRVIAAHQMEAVRGPHRKEKSRR